MDWVKIVSLILLFSLVLAGLGGKCPWDKDDDDDSSSGSSGGSSNIVYITATGDKYHRLGCQYLNQSKIAIDRQEAINQGYTACSVCSP